MTRDTRDMSCPYGYRGPFDRIYPCTSDPGHTGAHVHGEIKWTGANPLSVLIDGETDA